MNLALVAIYLGPAAAIGYGLCYLALAGVIFVRGLPARVGRNLIVLACTAAPLVYLAALYLLAPRFEGRLDRSEALTYWLSALASGKFPYATPTNLGHPISVLPTLPLLAAPFVALGNVGYLNVAAFLLLALLLCRTYRKHPRSQVFAVVTLASAPLVLFEIVARSELITNVALICLFITWLAAQEESGKPPQTRSTLGMGLFFGSLMATRLALLPTLAVPVLYLLRRWEQRRWLLFAAAAALAFAALVIPFAVWDPAVFFQYAPLGVNREKLGGNQLTQMAWLTLTGLTVLVSGFRTTRAADLFSAIVPVLTVTVLATWISFFVDLSYLQLTFVPLLFTLGRRVEAAGPRLSKR
jgi:hypothetical protein